MPNPKKRKLDSFKRTGGHDKANRRFCKSVLGKRPLRLKNAKSVPVLNQSPCHEDVLGSGNITPGFLIGALESEWPRFGRFTAEIKTLAHSR